jgi:Fic family protein
MKQTDQTIAMTLKRAQFWEINHSIDFNHRQQKVTQMLRIFLKLTVSKYAKDNGVSTDTALRDLQDLISKVFIAGKVVAAPSYKHIQNLALK